MNIFNLPLDSTNDIVRNSAIRSIVKDLVNILNIDPNILIYIDTDLNADFERYDTKDQSTIRKEYISVSSEYTDDTDFAMKTRLTRLDSRPILEDTEANLRFTPLWSMCEITNTITIKTKSKTRLDRILLSLRKAILSGRETNFHDVELRYYVPRRLYYLLAEVLKIKNSVLSETKHLEEYIDEIKYDKMVLAANVNAAEKSKSFVVVENQTNILGRFTDNLLDKKISFDKDTMMYSLEFNYAYTIDIPTYICIQYPDLIFNRLLPKEYIVNYSYIMDTDLNPSKGFSKALDNFLVDKMTKFKELSYIRVPRFDRDSRLMDPNPDYLRLVTVLCQIDPNSPRELFNLLEIPGIVFQDDVVNYMLEQYQYLNLPYSSLITLELFEDNELRHHDKITIDSDLNVQATIDLDVRKTYRVSINILVNTITFRHQVRDTLLKYPELLNAIRTFVNLDNIDYKDGIRTDIKITDGEYEKFNKGFLINTFVGILQ